MAVSILRLKHNHTSFLLVKISSRLSFQTTPQIITCPNSFVFLKGDKSRIFIRVACQEIFVACNKSGLELVTTLVALITIELYD